MTAALDSSIDFIVLAELAAFGAVGLYLFLTVALPPRRRRLPRTLVASWTLVSLLAASALWAPSPALALVRSIQLLITMALVTALARRAGERDLALVAHGFVLVVTCWIGVGIFVRSPPDNAALDDSRGSIPIRSWPARCWSSPSSSWRRGPHGPVDRGSCLS